MDETKQDDGRAPYAASVPSAGRVDMCGQLTLVTVCLERGPDDACEPPAPYMHITYARGTGEMLGVCYTIRPTFTPEGIADLVNHCTSLKVVGVNC